VKRRTKQRRWLVAQLRSGRFACIRIGIAASKFVRTPVPTSTVRSNRGSSQVIHVVAHRRFRRHFTGTVKQVKGQGQIIDFIATDIYRVANGRIAENWPFEDNLTLMQPLKLDRA